MKVVFKRYSTRNGKKNETLEHITCKCINRINLTLRNASRRKGNSQARIGRITVTEDETNRHGALVLFMNTSWSLLIVALVLIYTTNITHMS